MQGDAAPIDDPVDAAADPVDAPPPPPSIRHAELAIPGNVVWTDAGLDVVATEIVAITATGTINFGATLSTGPDGYAPLTYNGNNEVEAVRHAGLIGKIGPAGAPFRVGTGVTFTAPMGGRLYLGTNDVTTGGNSLAFAVTVDVGPIGTVATVPAASVDVAVPATVAWADTGLDLIVFEQLAFSTTGTVNLSATVTASADGSPDPAHQPSNVLPATNHGVLMAKIGVDGTPFAIGRSFAIAAPDAGRLYLGVNDAGLTNNAGTFTTSITVAGP